MNKLECAFDRDVVFNFERSRWYWLFNTFNALAFVGYLWLSPLRVEILVPATLITACLFVWYLLEQRQTLTAVRYDADGNWFIKREQDVDVNSQDAPVWEPVATIGLKRCTPLSLHIIVVFESVNLFNAANWSLQRYFPLFSGRKNITIWRDQLSDADCKLLRVLLSLG